jgi:hypothetical protein
VILVTMAIWELIVPCHSFRLFHSPFVYLNTVGRSLTDIGRTWCIGQGLELDTGDWYGFFIGDYDNDENLNLYIAESARRLQTSVHTTLHISAVCAAKRKRDMAGRPIL